jgi:type I restriction enzyme, S subunit
MWSNEGSAARTLHPPSIHRDLPRGWRWSRLDDVCVGIFDCPHSTPRLAKLGPYVARTQDIDTGVFRFDQAAHVSEETYLDRTARVTPDIGDLLYSREGAYHGVAAEIPKETRICLGQRMVLIRPDARLVSPRFLRFWLNSPVMAAHIAGYQDGSVAPRLNLPTIRALPILIPSLHSQHAIADVLGALDDKIQANRRSGTILEAIPQELFRSWFTRFDPWDRTPPADWRNGRLGDILALIRRPTKAGQRPELPYVPVDSIPVRSLGLDNFRPNAGAQSSLTLFEKNDILMGAMRVYFHRVSLAPFAGITRTTTFVLRPIDDAYLDLGLLLCNEDSTIGFAEGSSKGSTIPYAVWEGGLAGMPTRIPPIESARQFSSLVRPLLEQRRDGLFENQALERLRDALLPKLLSGDLRVHDAEDLVSEAV